MLGYLPSLASAPRRTDFVFAEGLVWSSVCPRQTDAPDMPSMVNSFACSLLAAFPLPAASGLKVYTSTWRSSIYELLCVECLTARKTSLEPLLRS